MIEAASLRCDGGVARVASGRRVATVLRSEASMAWARGKNDNYDDGGDDNYGRSRGCCTRARAKSEGGAKIDDNYGGGDDNYPRVVVETGRRDERKDVAGTGRNSCR